MEKTFDHEVKYISKVPDGNGGISRERIAKIATFFELDPTIKAQHILHFKLVELYKNQGEDLPAEGETRKLKLDSEALYDLTVKAINVLWVDNPNFNARDKMEMMTDSGALLAFGTWFLGEKITPFFQELMPD